MRVNIPETGQERIVIVGGGFAGLTLASKMRRSGYLTVLIDKNNYHQFQPLFYQVATAGLEPSSIVYPLRKMFHSNPDTYIRVTEVESIEPAKKRVITKLGVLNYDYLVLAHGADTNYYGNEELAKNVIPMKSVSEALYLRNTILSDFENALTSDDPEERSSLLSIVIVGGGATGVEIAGALSEMRQYVLPKDYPELDASQVKIIVIQGAPALLEGMSDEASEAALAFLEKMGVEVLLNRFVKDYDGEHLLMADGSRISAKKVIWAAGVRGNTIPGLPDQAKGPSNRLKVNTLNQVEGVDHIYAVGDIAFMPNEKYPKGHPQVAQVAMQQASNVAKNFLRKKQGKAPKPFVYKDLGSLATVGRRRAVADLPLVKFQGTFAWLIWLFVHLLQLIGFKNRLFVFMNWVWNYIFYDQSLRLIIRPKSKPS